MNHYSELKSLIPRLNISPFLGGDALNVNNPKWEDAGFRICFLQPGHIEPKLISNTLTQLVALTRLAEKQCGCPIYIDFAFRPSQRECSDLRKKNIPEVFGWCSFHSLSDFDVVACSFSVHFESASILASFWGGGISPFFYERSTNDPFIVAGGIMGQYLETLFGHPRGAVCDILFLGEGEERLTDLVHSLYTLKASLRSDRLSVIHQLIQQYDNLYFPNGYEHVYQGTILTQINKKFDWVPDKVKYFRSFAKNPPIFENRLLITDNDHAGRASLRVSQGCSGAGCCSFCSEGSEAGPWREYSCSYVSSKFDQLIESCAPNLVSFYAYNFNFHSEYPQLVQEALSRFSSHSVIAFRADVASQTDGYVQFIKDMGVSRFTIALEGISERIRILLNKNVTWEHFHSIAEQVFEAGIGILKVNLITTGFETMEDYDELFRHIDQFLARRDELGSNAKLSISTTVLVTYWNTALQWSPRLSIVNALKHHRASRLFEKCKERGVSAKLHSGYECILQQLLIDLGRAISIPVVDWYWDVWQGNKALYYPLDKLIDQIFLHVGVTDRTAFYSRERGYNELNPTSSYDIIPDCITQLWYKRTHPTQYCLKTVANPTPKCYGCNICSEELKHMNLTRQPTLSVPKISYNNEPLSAVHVVYNIPSEPLLARCMHKIVLCHYLASRIISIYKLTNVFHSVTNYSDASICANKQLDMWDGIGSFDIYFRCPSSELDGKFDDASNLDFSVARIVSIGITDVRASDSKFSGVWMFKTILDKQRLESRLQSYYDGKVTIRLQFESTSIKNGEIEAPLENMGLSIKETPDGSIGFLYLEHKVNPLMAVSSMFKWPLLRVRSEIDLTRLLLFEGFSSKTCTCGKPIPIDSTTYLPYWMCGSCASKAYNNNE